MRPFWSAAIPPRLPSVGSSMRVTGELPWGDGYIQMRGDGYVSPSGGSEPAAYRVPLGPAASCCQMAPGRSSVILYESNWSAYCALPLPKILNVCMRLLLPSATAAVVPLARNASP